MRSTVRIIFFSLLMLLGRMVMSAQEQKPLRPVTSAWTVEIGSVRQANTYLSPLRYSGKTFAFNLERWQAMRFSPQQWVIRLNLRAGLDRSLSPARNSVMWGLDFSGEWQMMHRWRNVGLSGLTLGAGAGADLDIGVLYLPRNGNNPAQAQAAATLGITAFATYSFKAGRLPMVVRYQPSVPLVGAFFCPDYGELYYEISLGNRSGLAHVAWPGSYRRFMSLLTVDLRFGATALRLGYRADVLSTKANNIVNRSVTHMATIGISGEWLMLSPRQSHDAEIITAYY